MANRSYIYGLKNGRHVSIGEYPYKIPYAFQILAAYDNSVADSDLFDKVVGIKADFAKGKNALYYLLDFLIETGQIKDQVEFEAEVAKTKVFLEAIKADQILLENGEIYALYTDNEGKYLDGEGLEKQNQYARQDYQWVGEDIDHLRDPEWFGKVATPASFYNIKDESFIKRYTWILNLKDNWKEQLCLDAWAKVLYFQFKEDDTTRND